MMRTRPPNAARRPAAPGARRHGTSLPVRSGRVVPALALLALVALAGCGGQPRATGELLGIQDDQHRIANPAKIGASATGRSCAVTKNEALTSARRVAQFNLRSLTGQARYNVRFDLLEETRTKQGWCVEVSALAVEPVPYER